MKKKENIEKIEKGKRKKEKIEKLEKGKRRKVKEEKEKNIDSFRKRNGKMTSYQRE